MDRQNKNWILCEERGSGIPLAPAVFVLYKLMTSPKFKKAGTIISRELLRF